MPERPRILAVEDDRDLLELTRVVLSQLADVDVADHAAAALRMIVAQPYTMLVTDLNICHPCDGLLLAASMRTLHPGSRTVLLTGNPDFTRALQFMQSTLDLIILKPVEPDVLRQLPELAAMPERTPARHPPGCVAMADVLAAHRTEILTSWLKMVESDGALGSLPLATPERLDHVTLLLDGLAGRRRDPESERRAAEAHGRSRRASQYRPEWVALEITYLRRAVMEVIMRSLLELDLAQLPANVLDLHRRLDADLLQSLHAFGLLA
jgi:CheY-like chemotaxis protein